MVGTGNRAGRACCMRRSVARRSDGCGAARAWIPSSPHNDPVCSAKSRRYHGMLEAKETNDGDVGRYYPGWVLCHPTCPNNCAGLRKSTLWAKLGADQGVVAGDLAGGDGAVGQRGRLLLWPSALGVQAQRRSTKVAEGRHGGRSTCRTRGAVA